MGKRPAGQLAGFTLIELLVVISIMAILYVTVVRSFVGFSAEAKVIATKSAVDSLRSSVQLFRAKEHRYPESLGELLTETYKDVGIERPYLRKLPPEQISSSQDDSYETLRSNEPIANDGGWNYFIDTAEIAVDYDEPLTRKWDDFEGEIPSTW